MRTKYRILFNKFNNIISNGAYVVGICKMVVCRLFNRARSDSDDVNSEQLKKVTRVKLETKIAF